LITGHRDHVAPGTLEQRHAAEIGRGDSWCGLTALAAECVGGHQRTADSSCADL
jgi:hypothetical protein